MIGKISGRIDMRGPDHVLIDTGGVGYIVYCSERTLSALPGLGEPASLYTELLVREDLLQLFGFRTLAEREWHRLLTSVQGVGARGALAILGTLGPEGLGRALSLGDAAAIKAAQGIGPKLAQRIVLELQAKAPQVMAMGASGATPAVPRIKPKSSEAPAPRQAEEPPVLIESGLDAAAQADALSALANLGYAPSEAAAAVSEAAELPEVDDASGLIRAALRLLAPSG
ncbi:Holliday junction branch migration protein RuvA [Amaricoccus macauensis]|uniref:Holliday junction branch migration protein RuvA n=1 Tax=Amaricoccus macauensis TaxID=57001 RepID=UPI003C7D4468